MAPSVPNHGEHTVSRRKRSGSAEGPEQRCQGVSPQHFSIPALSSPQDGRTEGRAVGGAGEGSRAHSPATLRCPCHPRKQRAASRLSCAASRDDAKTARGQGRLSASRALHPDTHPCLFTAAPLGTLHSGAPSAWADTPIFGAQLTPHTHGHQVPPVRSYDGSFWRRGPHKAVWSVTLGSSRARHPGVAGPCSAPTVLLLQAEEELVIPRGPARALPSSQPTSPSSSHEAGS